MTCTFFGEDCNVKEINKKLDSILINLVEENGINMFYMSNQNSFDKMVLKSVKALNKTYKHINYAVIISHNPNDNVFSTKLPPHTYMPYALANFTKNQAEQLKYKWMLDCSDYVITFVKSTTSIAAKFKAIAINLKREIIELSE